MTRCESPTPPITVKKPSRLGFWLVIGLVLLAAVLRFAVITNGLPFVFHEDEPIYLNHAMAFGFGDFDPDYFKKPSFFLYLYFALYYIAYLFSGLSSWQAFYDVFRQDPTTVVLWGRILTALFSTVSVGLLFWVGRRGFGWLVGILAALLLALDFTHLKTSANILADIPALCMILLTARWALKVYETGRLRDYIVCGLLTALVISFKYNVFSLAFLVSAHAFRSFSPGVEWQSGIRAFFLDKKIWLGGLSVGVGFLALSPFTLLNADRFIEHLQHEKQHMTLRTIEATHRSFQPMVGFDNIFFQIFPKAVGWPLYIAGLGGGVLWLGQGIRSLIRPEQKTTTGYPDWGRQTILLSFPLAFLLVLCQFRLVNAKYLLPIIPFWYLMAAQFVSQTIEWLGHKIPAPTVAFRWAVPVVLVALAWPVWQNTVGFVSQQQQENTRTEARLYLDGVIQPHQTVWAEPETAPISTWEIPKEQAILAQADAVAPKPLRSLRHYGVIQQNAPDGKTLGKSLPDYVLVLVKPVKGPQHIKQMPYESTYYNVLSQHYHLQRVFTPYRVTSDIAVGQPVQDWMALYSQLKPARQKPNRSGPVLVLMEKMPETVQRIQP